MVGPSIIQNKGPFPPTPENVWLALVLGAVVGAIAAFLSLKIVKGKIRPEDV